MWVSVCFVCGVREGVHRCGCICVVGVLAVLVYMGEWVGVYMCGCGLCTGVCGYVVWVVDVVCAYGFMCCVDVPVVWMARCRLGSVLCWCVGV